MSPWLRAGLAVVLLVLFVAGDAAPYLAWREVSGLPRGRLGADDLRRLELALSLNPVHPDYWLRKAEHLKGDGSDWDLERYAAAREAAERAVRLQPADQQFRRGVARIEALACRTLFQDVASRQRAAARYEEAEARSRYNPFIPMELAGFLLDTGDPARARRAARRALAVEPNAVPARLLLADAILARGGPRAASRAAELLGEARQIAQRWAHRRREGPYASELLRLDARAVDKISGKIADLEVEKDGGAGSSEGG